MLLIEARVSPKETTSLDPFPLPVCRTLKALGAGALGVAVEDIALTAAVVLSVTRCFQVDSARLKARGGGWRLSWL